MLYGLDSKEAILAGRAGWGRDRSPVSGGGTLMMGDVTSQRDRLAAAHVLTSLYVMEFEPGGTNFPHHHDAEEEIYVLLDGTGEMVAGSGTNGLEARFPATPGDAYFFRLNCTVGSYHSAKAAHILAVRSLFPRRGTAGR